MHPIWAVENIAATTEPQNSNVEVEEMTYAMAKAKFVNEEIPSKATFPPTTHPGLLQNRQSTRSIFSSCSSPEETVDRVTPPSPQYHLHFALLNLIPSVALRHQKNDFLLSR